MKTKKRSRKARAFSHGFRAGSIGHSEDFCPYEETALRGEWYAGWREGRGYFMDGVPDGYVIPETKLHFHILH